MFSCQIATKNHRYVVQKLRWCTVLYQNVLKKTPLLLLKDEIIFRQLQTNHLIFLWVKLHIKLWVVPYVHKYWNICYANIPNHEMTTKSFTRLLILSGLCTWLFVDIPSLSIARGRRPSLKERERKKSTTCSRLNETICHRVTDSNPNVLMKSHKWTMGLKAF